MFFSSNVQINWHKLWSSFTRKRLLRILRIKIAKIVPRRINKCVHRVCFPFTITITITSTKVQWNITCHCLHYRTQIQDIIHCIICKARLVWKKRFGGNREQSTIQVLNYYFDYAIILLEYFTGPTKLISHVLSQWALHEKRLEKFWFVRETSSTHWQTLIVTV